MRFERRFYGDLVGTRVRVYLTVGIRLEGILRGVGDDILLLDDIEGTQQIVYKHAISTVSGAPGRE